MALASSGIGSVSEMCLIKLIQSTSYKPSDLSSMHTMQLLHEYSPTHKLFKTTVADFLAMPVKNWRYNRTPDKARCREIAAHLQSKPIETVFYLASHKNKEKDTYEILDGIHRYTALKMLPCAFLEKARQKDKDIGEIAYVLLNIRYDATEGELVDFFKSLNKSIPVPDLYLQNPDQVKRDVIQSVVDRWEFHYAQHFSVSLKFQRPNMNRTVFINLLDDIYEKYDADTVDAVDLEEKLMRYNEVVRQQFEGVTIPKTAIEKCTRSGLWLFMVGYDGLLEGI